MSAVFELFPDPTADFEMQIRGYRNIAGIEQAVDVAPKQQTVLCFMFTAVAIGADMCCLQRGQCTFLCHRAASAVDDGKALSSIDRTPPADDTDTTNGSESREMPHGDARAVLEITPLFYEAALDPRRWPETLGLMADQFGAIVANVSLARHKVGSSDVTLYYAQFWPEDSAIREAYLSYPRLIDGDPRLIRGRLLTNRPLCNADVVEPDEWYASPIYRELFEPFGVDDIMFALVVDERSSTGLTIGFGRPPGQPYDEADLAHMQLYMPHLRGAMRVAVRHFADQAVVSALAAAIDEIGLATLVVDRLGVIQFKNSAADALVADRDAVTEAGNTLIATSPAAARELQKAIVDMAAQPRSGERRHLVLPRSDPGKPGLFATVAPAAAPGQDGAPAYSWSVIYLNDPLQSYETPAEQLQRLFGLTEAEADIAFLFAAGTGLRQIAADTDRSYETVRWHLRQIMSKLGVTRQADLMLRLRDATTPLTT